MADNSDSDESPGGGLVSPRQREWLKDGAPDPRGSSSHRNYRKRIISRVQRSLKDFSLLQNLPDEDLQRIYDDFSGWGAALTFLFRPVVRNMLESPTGMGELRSQDTDVNLIPSEELQSYFGNQLAYRIEEALDKEGVTGYSVDVDVEIEPFDVSSVDSAIEKLGSGARYQDLDRDELSQYLRMADRAGSHDLETVARERDRERVEAIESMRDSTNDLSADDFPRRNGWEDG